jgi:Ca2+-binding EF-hand superfamily protein
MQAIDEEELGALMSALGYEYSPENIRKILEDADEDGSGLIEIDEFIKFMAKNMVTTELLSWGHKTSASR